MIIRASLKYLLLGINLFPLFIFGSRIVRLIVNLYESVSFDVEMIFVDKK